MVSYDFDRNPANPRVVAGRTRPRRKKRTAAPLAALAGAMGFAFMAMTETMAKVVADALTQCAMQHHADRAMGMTLGLAALGGVAALAWLAFGRLGRQEQ